MPLHVVDNEDRRDWARAALDAFGEQSGQIGMDYADAEHLDEIAGDLIADLFHLANAAGLDIDALIERARDHHAHEHEDDEDDEDEEGPKTYDHDARPDDDNQPGDRCKDCGEAITWVGPSHVDWIHVAEQDWTS